MALVIPTSRSTFADATSLPGGPLTPYVLAQVPLDADFGWLHDIRRMAVVDEVKWKVFQARRELLQAKVDLWSRITSAMGTATIVVIKPAEVVGQIQEYLNAEGAKLGTDYDRTALIEVCSVSLVADTPVAYLPNRLSQTLGLYPLDLFVSFEKFVPEVLLQSVGGRLRDAKVFAARAHAMFDGRHLSGPGARTTDAFGTSPRLLVLQELLGTERTFDHEHPRSAQVLNDAADTIAESLSEALLLPGEISDEPLIKEFDSRHVDQLQAADIAAGWAHELLALGDERALRGRFGRILINGRVLT